MDDLIGIIVIVSILAVVYDYGRSGIFLVRHSINKVLVEKYGELFRSLTGGIGYLLLTVVGHVLFWLFNVLINEVFNVSQYVVLILVIIYAAFCFASIVGRRKWWDRIIKPMMGE